MDRGQALVLTGGPDGSSGTLGAPGPVARAGCPSRPWAPPVVLAHG
ncbi:hypothetical protein [Streptomyces sp. WMMB 322]|nr:hypothetical protein [Streptomyces sp. WMMB 322]SCK53650.1 hypothetical protein H180DRAFT_04884 [Streptomyces sp. WMMB 322]